MKSKFARSLVASLCCFLVACVNPYLSQMDMVEADYRAGRISRTEYNREMHSLNARSNAWSAQNSANVAMGATALGAAAIVGGALIEAEAREDVAHSINQHNKTHSKSSSHGSGNKSGGSGSKKSGSKSKSKKPEPSGTATPAPSPPAGGGSPPGKRPPRP